MKNEEALPLFIYKPYNLHNEIYYLLYVYLMRWWEKAQEAFD